MRVARALGLLRWLRLRLQGRAGGARGPGTSEGTSRGPGPRHRLALSHQRASRGSGGDQGLPWRRPGSPQVARKPSSRSIRGRARDSRSQVRRRVPQDPRGREDLEPPELRGRVRGRPRRGGRGWSCAGASADSAGRRASVEGSERSLPTQLSLSPNPHERKPPSTRRAPAAKRSPRA